MSIPLRRAQVECPVRARRRRVVERVERYLRVHQDAPVPINCLCRVIGCSERALRNAFYDVHGVGPKRWTVTERLMRANQALTASLGATTVTAVATDLGFYQLGRFAAIYKQRFGEVPSGTLRAAGRFSEAQSPVGERGDATSR